MGCVLSGEFAVVRRLRLSQPPGCGSKNEKSRLRRLLGFSIRRAKVLHLMRISPRARALLCLYFIAGVREVQPVSAAV